MCKPVRSGSVGSMYLSLLWCVVSVLISPQPSTAAELDIYPEFSDEVIMRRIQEVLTEWRQKQLRLQSMQDHEVLPQFTFHFPEGSSQNYQSSFFAVPPSDPRYYQQPEQSNFVPKDEKRIDESEVEQGVSSEPDTDSASGEGSWTEDVTSTSTEEPQVERADEVSYVFKEILTKDDQNILMVAIVAGCGAAAAAGVIALSVGWYKLHSNSKAAADIEYPAYGVTGPNKEITPTGDRRLAQSAQMYHYQHQKQQIIAMETNRANNERRGSVSEGDSDEENEEGDYTVYECPGLAATGELEVKNPLFLDDPTPAAGNQLADGPAAPLDKK